MSVFIITVLLLVYVLIKYLSRNFSYWKIRNVPYVQPVPIFGNCFDLVLQKYQSAIWLWNFYKSTTEPYIGIFLFARPGLVIRSPDLIKKMIVRDFQYFQSRSLEAAAGDHHPTFGKMLGVCSGKEWKNLRGKFSPIFTGSKLKGMFPLQMLAGKDMISYLENMECDEMNVKEIADKFSLDVLAKCVFGLDIKPFNNKDGKFMEMSYKIFQVSVKTALSQVGAFLFPDVAKMLKLRFMPSDIEKYFMETFVKSIEEREKSNVKRYDVIDAVITLKEDDMKNHENILSREHIVAQPLQFLLAGFETTSIILSFCLHELSKTEDVQNRLKAEIKDAISEDGTLSYEKVNNMKYLDMCVSEALRMYPILPFIDRVCNSDYKFEESGVTINKGTMVIVPVWALHHDPEYYPEPEKFDPERFSDENVKNILPYTYMPFGVGPRICIGERFGLMATKMGLVHILTNFKVIPSTRTSNNSLLQEKSLFLTPKNLFLKFVKDE